MAQINNYKSSEARIAIRALAFLGIVATLLIIGLLRLADYLEPRLGDIITFPASRVPSISTASMTVNPTSDASRGSCVLDMQVMQRSGGSLVIEATRLVEATRRMSGHAFQVHWAGLRTSRGQEDCGSSADFLLDSNQIAMLIFAAGGTGAKAARQ